MSNGFIWSWSYRFPEIKSPGFEEQVRKVEEEVKELRAAWNGWEGATLGDTYDNLLEEALDVAWAIETFLRMFPTRQVFEKQQEVIRKNARRGYLSATPGRGIVADYSENGLRRDSEATEATESPLRRDAGNRAHFLQG